MANDETISFTQLPMTTIDVDDVTRDVGETEVISGRQAQMIV